MQGKFSRELIENAFRRARKKAEQTKKIRDRTKLAKQKELARVVEAEAFIEEQLMNRVKAIPFINEMHPFYSALLACFTNERKLRKSLKHLISTIRVLRLVKKNATKLIHEHSEARAIQNARKEFYGRLASIVERAEEAISIINEAEKDLRQFPKVDFSLATLVLAGYPNVGKSTLLAKLTKAKPLIANYPFTTKGINLGYYEFKYRKIQVIDTPGLLDRPLEERNNIELQAIHALDFLEGSMLFVFDAGNSSGYTQEQQLSLLKQIAKTFKSELAVIINKTDLASGEELKQARKGIQEALEKNTKIILAGKETSGEALRQEINKLLEEKNLLDKPEEKKQPNSRETGGEALQTEINKLLEEKKQPNKSDYKGFTE
ncbi:50S ribosome-binding GTPase [archaeon]|nr:50S ribosome-binding GTPase [archaeon]